MAIESDEESLDQNSSRPWSSNLKYNNSRFTYKPKDYQRDKDRSRTGENDGDYRDHHRNLDNFYKGCNHIGYFVI